MRVHTPETGFSTLEAEGLTFGYLSEGEGPLAILVHGFPDTARTWDGVRPALAAAGYRAVSPQTRGIAPSGIPERDTDQETLGRDVLGWMDALGAETAVLVGHDWGACAVYAAAGLAPERVEKLVALAIPHPAALRPTPAALWGARHFLGLRLPGAAARFRADDYAGVERLVRRWSPSWDWPEGELEHDRRSEAEQRSSGRSPCSARARGKDVRLEPVKNAYAAPGCLDAALGYYRTLSPRLPACLRKRIAAPTLAIAGREDIAPLGAFHDAARRFTGPYEVLELDCGHFPHREREEEVLEAILGFLGRPGQPSDS